MVKAVIFDLYGTLIYFADEDYSKQLKEMASLLCIDSEVFTRYWCTDTHHQRMIGGYPTAADNVMDICRQLQVTPDYDAIQKAAAISIQYTKQSLNQFIGDVCDILAQLKNRNYKLGLLSDCSPNVPLLWKDTALSTYFDKTVFSCDVSMRKPDKRIYQLLCGGLGVLSSECYYVGDWSEELIGASGIGMAPIMLGSEKSAKNDTAWDGKRIAGLQELLDILK